MKSLSNEIYYARTHDLSSLVNAFIYAKPHFDKIMTYTARKDKYLDNHIIGVILQKSVDIHNYFKKQPKKVA